MVDAIVGVMTAMIPLRPFPFATEDADTVDNNCDNIGLLVVSFHVGDMGSFSERTSTVMSCM